MDASFLMPIFNEVSAIEIQSIAQEIRDSARRLSKGPTELFTLARKSAESERIYRKALAMEIMKLRLDGVQATLIPDIAKGNISDLLFNRDLSEAEWTAGRDGLKSLQCQVSALQSILRIQD